MAKKVEIEEDTDHLDIEAVLDKDAEPVDEDEWDDEDFNEEKPEETDVDESSEESW